MMPAMNYAFARLEDFSNEPEDDGERHQRELEHRVAEALEQGYRRGYETGRTEAEALSEVQISELKISFAEEISSQQASWQSDSGNVLVETLHGRLDSISDMLERHLAMLLKPLIKDSLYRDALQQFNVALDEILEKGVAVEIRGSQDLVRGAEERLGATSKSVSVVTSDDAAIEVKCDETVLSANFGAWLSKIEEGLV